jgi:hypothetical protein
MNANCVITFHSAVIIDRTTSDPGAWWRATERDDGTTYVDCKRDGLTSISLIPFDQYLEFHKARGCEIKPIETFK